MKTEPTAHPTLPGNPEWSVLSPVIAAITVTYNPEIAELGRQLEQLPPTALKVWIDNASAPELAAQIRRLAADRLDVFLIENLVNLGLAKALNQGASYVRESYSGCEYLVLLDQDTEPGAGGVESLLDAFRYLKRTRPRLGCVGPRLSDEHTGLEHGFHQISGWRWVRRYPITAVPLPVANLNGSGILMPVQLFHELGGLNEAFFIDHVDTEWSFRVIDAGFELFGIPGTNFKHRMGEKGIRFWCLGWRLWPYRSPGRHFYLFRNTVRLLFTERVPGVWKFWAPIKLMATLIAHLLFDSARWLQVWQMLRGILAGLSAGAGHFFGKRSGS